MRLLRMHIAGFGRFYNADFDFNEGLNCISRENGYGKTTLAAFIRVMFYGMESYRADTKAFTDRQHYYPFGFAGNSPAYGGNIEFEYQGNEYRIERTFGEKNQKDDKMTVYKSSLVTSDLGECPGKTVFRVDSESFARTLFFRSDDTLSGSTKDINAAMNRFLENTCDGITAEDASSKLMDAAYAYRGKRGSTGKIAELDAQRSELRARLVNYRAVECSLELKYAQRKRMTLERAETAEAKRRSDAYAVLKANVQRYEEKLELAKKAGEKADKIKEKYPLGLPLSEECSAVAEAGRRAAGERVRYDTAAFPEEKQQRLSALDHNYPAGFPDSREFELLKNNIDRVHKLDKDIENSTFRKEDEERLKALIPFFIDHTPESNEYALARTDLEKMIYNEQKIAQLEAANPLASTEFEGLKNKFRTVPTQEQRQQARLLASEYRETDKKLSAMILDVSSLEKKKNIFSWVPAAIMGTSVVCLIIGVIMLISGSGLRIPFMIAGISLLVLAVLLFGIDAMASRRKRKNRDLELLTLSAAKNKISENIKNMLAPFSYYGEDVLALCSSFEADLERHASMLNEAEISATKLSSLRADASSLREALEQFIKAHGIQTEMLTSVGMRSALDRAERISGEYLSLSRKRADMAIERERLSKEKRACLVRIDSIFNRYLGSSSDKPEDIFERLVRDKSEQLGLIADKNRSSEIRKDALEAIAEARRIIAAVIAKYGLALPNEGFETEFVSAVNNDREALAALNEEKLNGYADAEKFRLEYCPDGLPEVEPVPSEVLEEKLTELDRSISALDREIENCEADVALIPDYKNKIDAITEEIADMERRRKLLIKAAQEIEAADRHMIERYIAPVRDRFDYYSEKLGSLGGIKLSMDENFTVRFDANSGLRDDRFLSDGQRTVCSLCLRLALTDNVFTENKPFLVLDDPFSNLDKEGMELCSLLVTELASDFQIIYFCCHDSRVI